MTATRGVGEGRSNGGEALETVAYTTKDDVTLGSIITSHHAMKKSAIFSEDRVPEHLACSPSCVPH